MPLHPGNGCGPRQTYRYFNGRCRIDSPECLTPRSSGIKRALMSACAQLLMPSKLRSRFQHHGPIHRRAPSQDSTRNAKTSVEKSSSSVEDGNEQGMKKTMRHTGRHATGKADTFKRLCAALTDRKSKKHRLQTLVSGN